MRCSINNRKYLWTESQAELSSFGDGASVCDSLECRNSDRNRMWFCGNRQNTSLSPPSFSMMRWKWTNNGKKANKNTKTEHRRWPTRENLLAWKLKVINLLWACEKRLPRWYHTSAAAAATTTTTDDEIQEIFHHNLYLCIIFSLVVAVVVVVVILPQLPFSLELQLSLVHFLLGSTRHGIIIDSILFTFCSATAATATATVHLYIFLALSFLYPHLLHSRSLTLFISYFDCVRIFSHLIFSI